LAENRAERRLAAVLAADVAGYSRLMGADEESTLSQLKAHRRDLIDPKIAEHRGRIVKTTGDGILVEFPSVVDAARCAIDVQRGMAERNSAVPQSRRIEFRVGVHIGDIIIEGGDIFGDGVNIAARLESIAETGGVCVSEDVYRQLRGKLDAAFEDRGAQQLKNIAHPVRVYWIRPVGGQVNASAATPPSSLPLPDKPSIAVLPFQNMSGDPEQEYFADGIVEDIITALSRFRQLFVIARNSSFVYKGRAVDVKQVGRELGVRYVLEGSVRKAANRVRITGQLIDTATGTHLWADRFDGALEDVFDLQDQVTASVVGAIAPALERAEIERAKRKGADNLDAYDYYLRGVDCHYRWTREATNQALRLCNKAIELDPNFSPAYGIAARSYVWKRANGWCTDLEKEDAEALQIARLGVKAGTDDAIALAGCGFAIAFIGRDLDAGATFIDRALTIDSNSAANWHVSSWVRTWLGQPDSAVDHEMRALRLSPLDPRIGLMHYAAGSAHFCAGRVEEAVLWLLKATRDLPNWPAGVALAAASYALVGRQEEAHHAAAHLRELVPNVRIADITSISPFRRPEDTARLTEGMRKAGLPD
jgi:adenylate cyclase